MMAQESQSPTVAVFKCAQCARVDRILIRDLTLDRLMLTAVEHWHPERSNPGTMREDVETITRFFDAANISLVEPALRRRNLELTLE